MSFLQKRKAVLAGTAFHYKAAVVTVAFLLYAGCSDPGFAHGETADSISENAGDSTVSGPAAHAVSAADYAWPDLNYRPEHTIAARIAPPPGARRVKLDAGGFGSWLRHLPLKPGRPEVLLHDGRVKPNQAAHHAVIDIDTGARNLQQCADAIMRLRSEYFFARNQGERIRFRFTDESEARYDLWARGYRPLVRERRKTRWTRTAAADAGYEGFRAYLQNLFTYAGTYSLSRESVAIRSDEVRVGDFLIQGGFPGHAVLAVDMAEARTVDEDGRRARYVLLAQSYMPAQDMHVLRNPAGASPWYQLEELPAPESPGADGETPGKPQQMKIQTPEWKFSAQDWMRFRN
ncbi:MAG: DUF4846 domain-containing protein [bacterium]|nr:DUF4846 domain-containing protein [bacterium]